MNLLTRMFGRKQDPPLEDRSSNPFADFISDLDNYHGATVTPSTATSISTVYAAVNLISGAIAATPIHVFAGIGKDKARIADSELTRLLNGQANPVHTSYDLMSFLVSSLLLYGNGYAQIQRRLADGSPIALWPIPASAVTPRMVSADRIVYDVHDGGRRVATLEASEMLHVRRLSPLSTIVGASPIESVPGAFRVAKSTEEHAASFFRNGAVPLTIISPPNELTAEQKEAAADKWNKRFSGSKAHSTAVVSPGTNITKLSIEPDKAQLIESRMFSREQVAEIFNVPPSLLGIPGQGFSSAEQASLHFATYTLRPWLACIEAALTAGLAGDLPGVVVRFDRQDLIIMDTDSQVGLFASGKQNGYLSVNEIRERMDLPGVEGGDEHVHQLNLTPITDGPQGPGAPILRSHPALPDEETRAVGPIARTLDEVSRDHEEAFTRLAEGLETLSEASEREGVSQTITPAMEALAAEIVDTLDTVVSPSVAREVTDAFLPGFIEGAADRWIRSVDIEDRPRAFAFRETRRLVFGLAREVWKAGGIERLEWTASGVAEEDRGLDGQTIDLQADERFKTNDGLEVKHPPVGPGSFGTIAPHVAQEEE